MKRSFPTLLILAATLRFFAPVQAVEPDASSVTIGVPGGDSIAIRIPAGWKSVEGKPQADAPPTLEVSSPGGVQLNLTMMADPDGRFATPEAVDELVTIANQHYGANAIEKNPKLVRLTVKAGHGAYCTFTDARLVGVATPAAGEYRNVTTGVYVLGKQAVIFAILSNDTTGEDFRRALDLISNGISVAGAAR
jgi:hypothetical protein